MVAILMLLGQSVAFSPSISTAWLRSSQLRSTAVSESAPPQVFIGNMPFSVTEDDLKNLVAEKLGGSDKFASLKIAKDRETKKSRGFGYVNFESQKDAEEAVSKLMGLSIEGREVKVDLSVPKEQRPPRTDAPRAPRATIPADQSGDVFATKTMLADKPPDWQPPVEQDFGALFADTVKITCAP